MLRYNLIGWDELENLVNFFYVSEMENRMVGKMYLFKCLLRTQIFKDFYHFEVILCIGTNDARLYKNFYHFKDIVYNSTNDDALHF